MTEAPATTSTRRWTTTFVIVVVVSVAMVAMWAYVLFLAIGPGRQPPPDRLEDPAFAEAAQARCDEALDAIALLPPAIEAPDADARADVIDRANAELAAMLDDLAELVPPGEDGEIAAEWLADWRTYLGDRQAYAEALREDPEARLLVSAKGNDQVTEHIDAFAADNHMPACGTPIDV